MNLPQWVKDQLAVKAAEQMPAVRPAPYLCTCGATHSCPQDLVSCRSLHALRGLSD